MIIHNGTGDLAEYSMDSPSPYQNYTSNLYYGGMAQFYHKENDSFFHTITGKAVKEEELLVNDCKKMNESFQYKNLQSYLKLLNTKTSYTYIPSYSWLYYANSNTRLGYMEVMNSAGQSEGCCGYIAGGLLMFYFEKTRTGNWVNSTYISNGYLNGPGLTQKLLDTSYELGYTTPGIWAYDLAQILTEYLSNQGVGANISWMIGGASNIYTAIDNGIPAAVFGSLTNPSGGNNVSHAVVAYGYNSSGEIIVNYGWAGYSNVTLGSGTIVGSTCVVTPN